MRYRRMFCHKLGSKRRFGFLKGERGLRAKVTKKGVPQKCVRGRASGATVRPGHVLRVFRYSTVETRHFDTSPHRLGYVSDTYPCAPALCLEAVPEKYPPSTVPPLRLFQNQIWRRGIIPESDLEKGVWVNKAHTTSLQGNTRKICFCLFRVNGDENFGALIQWKGLDWKILDPSTGWVESHNTALPSGSQDGVFTLHLVMGTTIIQVSFLVIMSGRG